MYVTHPKKLAIALLKTTDCFLYLTLRHQVLSKIPLHTYLQLRCIDR